MPAPDGLFAALVKLDRNLGALIDDERTQGLDFQQLSDRINQIRDEKRSMVTEFFTQDTYGVPASEVILNIDCLDSELSLSYGVALEAHDHLVPVHKQAIAQFLETGKKCKQTLENDLHNASAGAPDALFTALVTLDRNLGALIDDERTQGLDFQQLSDRINQIRDEKRSMVGEFFTQNTYGVPASEVILNIDCLDSELSLSYGVALEAHDHLVPVHKQAIAQFLETGKKCKQTLENDLHNASGQETAMGSLSNGSGTVLAYSIETNTAANAFEVVLPGGSNITGKTFPAGFSSADCSDSANVEMCTSGTVKPNTSLTGSFDHTGTIGADCGCVRFAFSQNNGASWFPSPPATMGGPPNVSTACQGQGTTGSMTIVYPSPSETYGETDYPSVVPASCTGTGPRGEPPYGAYLIQDSNGQMIDCHQDSRAPVPPGVPTCPGGNADNGISGPNGSAQTIPPALTLVHSTDKTWTLVVATYNVQGTPPTVSAHVVYSWAP